jgi:hypothetical protein
MEKCLISHPSSIPHCVLVAVGLTCQTGWPLVWGSQWGKTSKLGPKLVGPSFGNVNGGRLSKLSPKAIDSSFGDLNGRRQGSLVPSFLAPRFGLSMGEDKQAQSETEWSLVLRCQ